MSGYTVYAYPFPRATPVPADSPCCQGHFAVGERGYVCTREIGHKQRHEAGIPGGKKMADWT